HVNRVMIFYSNSDLESNGAKSVETFDVMTKACGSELLVDISATYTIDRDGFIWNSTSHLSETVQLVDHFMYLTISSRYNYEGTGIYEGNLLIETNGSYNIQPLGEPDLSNSIARILLPMEIESPELLRELEAYGFDEDVPENGYLITIPFLDAQPDGSTMIYLPDPIGSITENVPFILDGITSDVGAIPIEGSIEEMLLLDEPISFTRTIDVGSYDSPISSMYGFDQNQLMSELQALADTSAFEMPDMPDMEDLPGMDDLDIPMPSSDSSGMEGLMIGLEALMGGATTGATVTIEVKITPSHE
ncbi:MAG: hypothetical protein PF505_11810, partial [Vallitaleaceae bacterium]|nr:hypothetical protein [Vallitaleaceae bacterium]